MAQVPAAACCDRSVSGYRVVQASGSPAGPRLYFSALQHEARVGSGTGSPIIGLPLQHLGGARCGCEARGTRYMAVPPRERIAHDLALRVFLAGCFNLEHKQDELPPWLRV